MDESIFFKRKKAKFHGVFMGFKHSLLFDRKIEEKREKIFLYHGRKKYEHLLCMKKLIKTGNRIFYKKDYNHVS